MNDDKLAIIFGLLAIVGFILFIAVLVISSNYMASLRCKNQWASFPNKFDFVGRCQIEVGGKWIPADSYYFKQE